MTSFRSTTEETAAPAALTSGSGRPAEVASLSFRSNEGSSTPDSFYTSPSVTNNTLLKNSFDKHARPLLDTIDLIRSLGLEGRDFQLPKIVVIGDQSVGKSSCLEALSGIQLPRGDGIVTRTPLEKRMRTSRNGTNWRCTIRYKDEKDKLWNMEIGNPSDVSKFVKEAQSRITGDNSSISDSLITLDVESPDVPDLTLIDLPGIARYSDGNPQIEQQIKQLIKKYIQSENTIILAVFPAGTNVEVVAALRLARDVDPELKRTMGVITKMDVVGPGSEKFVIETLENKKVKLNLGMYAVRCRTQEEVEREIPLQEAYRKEEDFFHEHPHFGNLNPTIFGIRRVSEKMILELTGRITDFLPEMGKVVSERLMSIKKEIAELGQGPSSNAEERRREFLALLTQYTDEVEKVSSGLYRHQNNRIKLFTMWRKETHVFAGKVRKVTEQGVKTSLEKDDDIMKTLEMQRGCELPGFVNSFPVCESIIDDLLVGWKGPAMEYVAAIRNDVEMVLRELASQTFEKFPRLAMRVKEIVDERLQIAIQSTEADIKKIFNQEAIVWTQDDTYLLQLGMVKSDAGNRKRKMGAEARDEPETKKPRMANETDKWIGWDRYAMEVMDGVSAYMQVASRRIMDTIPQSVHYHSLKVLSEEIKEYVLSIASNTDVIDDLFQETEEIANQRAELLDLQQRWRKAEKQLATL